MAEIEIRHLYIHDPTLATPSCFVNIVSDMYSLLLHNYN